MATGATPVFKGGKSSSEPAPASGGPIEDTFKVIKGVLNPDVVKTTQGVYKFDLSGETLLDTLGSRDFFSAHDHVGSSQTPHPT